MKTYCILLVLTLALYCTHCQQKKSETEATSQPTTEMALTNKEKAVALINTFNTGDQEPISYINPNKYIQHNLAVGDGLAGFGEVMANPPEGGFSADIKRSLQDGDYVVLHSGYDFFGPKVGFDVFRFEDGLIVEHWDNLIEVKDPNPSGRTQLDGPTDITDLDKTEANKALVKGFVETILMKGEMDKVTEFVNAASYTQHNPSIGDGLEALGAALAAMAEQGIVMKYETLHKVLGEGNFVLTMSEGTLGETPTSYYDLFRVEDGKIVEHWDVIESIMPEDQRKNNNGKF